MISKTSIRIIKNIITTTSCPTTFPSKLITGHSTSKCQTADIGMALALKHIFEEKGYP